MTIYNISFPTGFDVADSVLVPPVAGADGKWYFSVYGKKAAGSPALTYLCRWGFGMTEVEFVTLDVYTTARGAPTVGPGGARLWLFGFNTGKRLIVQLCPDWAPPAWMGIDPRVDALVSQNAALHQRIVELETALGNVRAGGLDAGDREALDRVRELLRIK